MACQTNLPFSIRMARVIISIALCLFLFLHSGISSNTWLALPQISTIQVTNEYPHDPDAFTESSVRKVMLQTGKVVALQEMDTCYFGEGLTLLDERLYQLTWAQKIGFIYDRKNLSKILNFTHEMDDGWGLATDGKILFGSDGSSTLYHIDPQTMKVIQKQNVRYKDREVHYLNELEFVNGEVWANVFPTDCIVRISPRDGTVLGWILLPMLRERLIASGDISYQDVLNGIAWDSAKQRVFVTGKLWPKLYEIKVYPMKEQAQADIEKLCIVDTQSITSNGYAEE